MRAHRRDDSSSADASGRDAARVPRVRASAVGWAGTHQLARALAFALVLSEPVLRELLVALQAAQPLDRLGNVLADVARRLHGRAREEHGHLDRRLRCLARGRVAGENDKGGRNAPRYRKKSTFLTSRNRESQTVVLARFPKLRHTGVIGRGDESWKARPSFAAVMIWRATSSVETTAVSICCLTSVDCFARQTDGRAGRDTRGERSRVGFRRDAPAFISRLAASNTPSRA